MKYWFRPKKFWKYYAFYYPANLKGWIITIVLLILAVYIFKDINANSYSISNTLINFAPWAIGIMLTFDLLCFRLGEYPSWWKKRN